MKIAVVPDTLATGAGRIRKTNLTDVVTPSSTSDRSIEAFVGARFRDSDAPFRYRHPAVRVQSWTAICRRRLNGTKSRDR
jgi:hypothetical protein